MKRHYLLMLSAALVLALATGVALNAYAASNLKISMTGPEEFLVTGTADTDDVEGGDLVCVVCRDSANEVTYANIFYTRVGDPINISGRCMYEKAPIEQLTKVASQPSGLMSLNGTYTASVYDIEYTEELSEGEEKSLEGLAAVCESYAPETATSSPTTCIDNMPIPDWAVGGTFLSDATLYWKPSMSAGTPYTLPAGKSALVLGVDESGEFAKIIWGCDMVWVDAGSIGPNPDYPWNGTPLPTVVVD